MAVLPVAVIGGGPAGLMAAECIAQAGWPVVVYDSMPSVGRKFLLAGRGGLNLTHSETGKTFLGRYGRHAPDIAPLLDDFGAGQIRDWAQGLGIPTFVGTSGRVFPEGMKAAPLLRAWLARLRQHGVRFCVRHRWLGWRADSLLFASPQGEVLVPAAAVVLALGGASWPQLGSDGGWVDTLSALGVAVSPLKPSNCGFELAWSAPFASRYAGVAIKNVVAEFGGVARQGELMVRQWGIEGGLVYAFSGALRETLEKQQPAVLSLDLAPGRDFSRLVSALAAPRGRDSWANHLRKKAGIEGVKAGLLREGLPRDRWESVVDVAQALKATRLALLRPRPIAEAISSAGGIRFSELDHALMLKRSPGLFCAGEMLDWDAPTGGYLLTGVLASGRRAGLGVAAWLREREAKAMMHTRELLPKA